MKRRFDRSPWVPLAAALAFSALACNRPLDSRQLDAGASPPPGGNVTPGPSPRAEISPEEASPAVRKLIRTARLEIEVAAIDAAVGEVRKLAVAHGGFVARESTDRADTGAGSTRIEIRVVADRLEGVLAALRALGNVDSAHAETRDVTREVLDLETRLAVKRATEGRLLTLLRERPASVADIVEITRELDRVVTEIERLEGERRFLEHEVMLAAVDIGLVQPGARRNRGLSGPAGQAVRHSWDVFGASVAGLIYIVVFIAPWMAVATMLWWVIRFLRRRSIGV